MTDHQDLPSSHEEQQRADAERRVRARAQMLHELADELTHSADFMGHLMHALLENPSFIREFSVKIDQMKAQQAALAALPVRLLDTANDTAALMVQRVPLNAPENPGGLVFYSQVPTRDEAGEVTGFKWKQVHHTFQPSVNVVAEVDRAIAAGEFEPGLLKYVDFICPTADGEAHDDVPGPVQDEASEVDVVDEREDAP